ncbi:MAG: hypothetical protein GY710_12255 [Desulfobacteraceae bacterium]|nr:hypothetical protein [Desulfobacteraceae bacterium]
MKKWIIVFIVLVLSVGSAPGADWNFGSGTRGEDYSGSGTQFKLDFGDFRVSLVAGEPVYFNGRSIDTATSSTNGAQVKFPAIQAQYKLARDNWFSCVSGGYQSFEPGFLNGQDVDSYMVAGSAGISFGQVFFTGSIFTGTNVGNIASADISHMTGTLMGGSGYAAYVGTTMINNDAFGYTLAAVYTINDMFGLKAAFGYAKTEYDGFSKDDVMSYYLQAPVTMVPGVSFIPEVGGVDYEQNSRDQFRYLSAKWQINF